jgi:hypothetical protein
LIIWSGPPAGVLARRKIELGVAGNLHRVDARVAAREVHQHEGVAALGARALAVLLGLEVAGVRADEQDVHGALGGVVLDHRRAEAAAVDVSLQLPDGGRGGEAEDQDEDADAQHGSTGDLATSRRLASALRRGVGSRHVLVSWCRQNFQNTSTT